MSVGAGPWIDPGVLVERADQKAWRASQPRRPRRTAAWARGFGIWLAVILALGALATRDGALALLVGF